MKYADARPFADPEKAARKLMEIASTIEPVKTVGFHIEKLNAPFLATGSSPAEYGAGLAFAIERGWLWKHESGTLRDSLVFRPMRAHDG